MDLGYGQRPLIAGRATRGRIVATPAYLAPSTALGEHIRWPGVSSGAAPVAMR